MVKAKDGKDVFVDVSRCNLPSWNMFNMVTWTWLLKNAESSDFPQPWHRVTFLDHGDPGAAPRPCRAPGRIGLRRASAAVDTPRDLPV